MSLILKLDPGWASIAASSPSSSPSPLVESDHRHGPNISHEDQRLTAELDLAPHMSGNIIRPSYAFFPFHLQDHSKRRKLRLGEIRSLPNQEVMDEEVNSGSLP